MITCTWCGTSYAEFQSSCSKCGGSLPLPPEPTLKPVSDPLRVPPPPPRDLPRYYVGRVLSTDAAAIVGGVFLLLGLVFFVLGIVLTITAVAIFVGLPFAGLGLLFLIVGMGLGIWRYQAAQRTVEILRNGPAVLGEIVQVTQNYQVQVNGRHPWRIGYRFVASGRSYSGKVSTLSQPDLGQQPGNPVYVVHAAGDPTRNTLYPHPFGYYGL